MFKSINQLFSYFIFHFLDYLVNKKNHYNSYRLIYLLLSSYTWLFIFVKSLKILPLILSIISKKMVL